MKRIGTVLKEARVRAGLSQNAVARSIGMATAQLSQIEVGRSGSPEFTTVAKIAPVIGLSLDQIAAECGLPGFASVADKSMTQSRLIAVTERLEKLLSTLANASTDAEAAKRELHEELEVILGKVTQRAPKRKR